jgi:hypothetical protein
MEPNAQTPPASSSPPIGDLGVQETKGAVLQKKYIRTFAGDMESVKKGIIPNLSPMKAPPEPAPVPVNVVPPPQAVSSPKPEPPSAPLETYEGDFSKRMKSMNASTATVLAAEQDAISGESTIEREKPPHSNILYLVAGALLLVLGISGSYFAYTRYLTEVQPVIVARAVTAPIFVDEKEKISAEGAKELLQAVAQSSTRALAPNTVRFIYTDSATTTDKSIFSALQLPAPGALIRNINASLSMAGIVSTNDGQHPFFIISVASYSDTFAGMLSWEATMPRNLSALFPPYPQNSFSTTTASTSTPTLPTSFPSFRDEIVNNHDARVYRDSENRSIIIYGYWNQTTLVIARDPSAFSEILDRLATARR